MQLYKLPATVVTIASLVAAPIAYSQEPKDKPYTKGVLLNHIEYFPGSGLTIETNPKNGMGEKKRAPVEALPLGHGGYTLNALVRYDNQDKGKEFSPDKAHQTYTLRCFVNLYDSLTGQDLPDIWVIETDHSINKPETIKVSISLLDSPNPTDASHWIPLEDGRTKSVLDGLDEAYIPWYMPAHIKTAKWIKVEDAYSRLQLQGTAGFDQSGIRVEPCEENISKSGSFRRNFVSLESMARNMTFHSMQ